MMVVRTIKPPNITNCTAPSSGDWGVMLVGIKTLVNQIGGWGQGRQLIRAGVMDAASQEWGHGRGGDHNN